MISAKKIYFYTVIFLFQCVFYFGQSRISDSLLNLLKNSLPDTSRIEILNSLGRIGEKTEQAKQYFHEALCSDDFADTFNGQNNKKLTTKKFKQLLLEIQNKSMPEQEKHLDNFNEKNGKRELNR